MYNDYNVENISSNIGDEKLSKALMSTFVVLMIQYFILITFNFIDTHAGNIIQITSKILVGSIYINALPIALNRNMKRFIEIYFISIFIFVINYLVFIKNRDYIFELIFPFFFTCLPSLIYCDSIYDLKILKKIMIKASHIIAFFGLVLGILIFIGKASIGSYSMSLSYYILVPSIIYLDGIIDKFTFSKALLILMLLIIILALGSRGPVLCLITFFILKLLKKEKALKRSTILVYCLIIVLLIFFIINFKNILNLLYNTLLYFGISSRTIQLFLKNGTYLSGRDIIYKNIINAIKESPIFVLGLAGDRVINGSYAHNLFIEIIADFGIVLGLIISFILLFIVSISIMKKSMGNYNIIIIWFSLGFVNLMVSGSYLIDIKFWIFIGLLIRNFRFKGEELRVINKKTDSF